MIRLIICLLLFLPAVAFAQDWKTFNDTSILFTAKYPAGWVNKIKEGKRVFFTSPRESENDGFQQNINVSVTTDPRYGTTLEIKDIIQTIIDKVKESLFVEFTEESRSSIKWNDIDAIETTYSGNTKSDEKLYIRITQRVCFYKTRLYLVTYTGVKATDIYAETAKQIINSIKFKP